MKKLLLILIVLFYSCTIKKPIVAQVWERWEITSITKYKKDNLSIVNLTKVGTKEKLINVYLKGVDYKRKQYVIFASEKK